MPPSFDFQDLWSKEEQRGTPGLVKMDNPSWDMLELEGPNPGAEFGKGKNKNAKQLTWVLLLKAHRAAGCVAYLAMGLWTLLAAIQNRLIAPKTTGVPLDKPVQGKLYKYIRFFLVVALVMLCLEVGAHTLGWHFSTPSGMNVWNLPHAIYMGWMVFRLQYIGPALQLAADSCIVLFLIQSADRIIQFMGCMYVKIMRIKPVPVNPSLESDDPEQPDKGYPMVLIQIPMCNEREVYEQSISAVCQIEWPRNRMLVQVLDDSDDVETQELIAAEVHKWHLKGINIIYRHRENRTGYKAGNLRSAMGCEYVKEYEYVAIFDADFQPKSDFLKRSMPHFKENPELCLVQTRWAFVNKEENLLTRLQNINLCFHFEVEQQVNGHFLNFFGFNGTAGVWRISALESCGGWMDRTTVEDMDIAVRAHLDGWKFIFLNDVRCLCELPESYEAYRKQQHRWHSGPMQLFRLCLPDIVKSKLPVSKKANLIFLFFLLRKLILPFYSFTLFCVILPLTMFVPEAQLPVWVVCYVPVVMSFMNILPAPKSFPFLIPYLLFENTMSVTKFQAMISGLFQLSSSLEWVVTKKSGRASEADLVADTKNTNPQDQLTKLNRVTSESGLDALKKEQKDLPASVPSPAPSAVKKKKKNRLYWNELALACLLLTAAARSLLTEHGVHFYFLLFQGISFLVVGLDLIGEQVS